MSTVERVTKCLGEVLALDPKTITADARVIDDLGADSLDLVELMFLLEREFSIRLDKRDLSLSAQLGLTEQETHHEEVLTPKAMSLLRERYPLAADRLRDGMTRKDLAVLLTVGEIAWSIDRKLANAGV
ncbi:MAG: phosphopantetheine-binding protein [Acidobacteriota bacterium]